jgi:hypothetical protein
MSRIYKSMLLSILIVTALACGVITNPIAGAKDLAATAQALASAIPSGLPDVSKYLNPQGSPVSEWNGIPIMTQATAGEEFSKNTYSYRVSGVQDSDVQSFYTDKMKALGWSSPFSAQGGSAGGLMLFTKDTSVLSITITKADQDLVVLLAMQ